MELRTPCFTARFDKARCNFVSLVNLRDGDEYLKRPPRSPIVELYALRGTDKVRLLPEDVRVSGTAEALTVEIGRFGDQPIAARLNCAAAGDRLTISATVENHGTWDVVEVLLPYIGGMYLGADYRDDILVYPHHAGEKTQNPVEGYGCHRKDLWRASSVAYEDIFRREINYCGLASMSWMYYYDAGHGFYIGSHDTRFPVTGVLAETGGRADNAWMGFAFRKHVRIAPGARYDTGDYVLAVSARDWHYGARIYRAYLAPKLDFDHNPAFLADEYALNQCYNFKRGGRIEHRFADIPALYEAGRRWGVRHMFIAGWNRTGFDSFYPEYYPDMELGSAMAFRRAIEGVRAAGGFTTLYINARIFDEKSDFHATLGERMGVRDEKGNLCHETYGPEHFTVNCPSDRLWRDYLIDTAEFCMQAYGCDGVYLDQLASAEPLPCYSAAHSHADVGEFNNGYVTVLQTLLKRLRAIRPDAYLMTENCGDIYGSYTWGNLTWNGADYDEHYNVFKYTFPEFVQVNMVNPRAWAPEEEREHWFRRDLHRAITLGSVLWLGITTRLSEEHPEYHGYAREATAFRASLQPLLKGAAFLDDAWFSEPLPPAVYATCWRLPDGRGLVLAANDTERPFALPVRPDFPCTGAACRLLGEPDARRLGAGPDGLCLTLQPGALAMLLLDGGGR